MYGITVFVDRDGMQSMERRIRTRMMALGALQLPGARLATFIVDIDCGGRTVAPVEAHYFDAQGTLLEDRTITAQGRRALPPEPGSPDEAVERFVCGIAYYGDSLLNP